MEVDFRVLVEAQPGKGEETLLAVSEVVHGYDLHLGTATETDETRVDGV